MSSYKSKELQAFDLKIKQNSLKISKDKIFHKKSLEWMIYAEKYRYVY